MADRPHQGRHSSLRDQLWEREVCHRDAFSRGDGDSPHWFDHAVRLGMGGLSTKPYERPDPEVLKGVDELTAGKGGEKGGSKPRMVADVEKNDLKKNMYATAALFTSDMGRSSPPNESDICLVTNSKNAPAAVGTSATGGIQTNVWDGRRIVLSRTLELYRGRREAVEVGIIRAGGVVRRFEGEEEEPEEPSDEEKRAGKELSAKERIRRRNEAESLAECDVLVTRWRFGRAYVQAMKSGKIVGTLSWLFHVQSTGIFTPPMDQLLHYPVPKCPIESFSNHVITVTNWKDPTAKLAGLLSRQKSAT